MTGMPALPQWDGDVAASRALQADLANQVLLRDDFATPLRIVAGFDVGFEDDGTISRVAVVVLDAQTLHAVESHVARIPARIPAIPGLLSFRELPALLHALALLRHTPDLVFINGQGIAHPCRLGIAAHFGIATGLPSIGVATKILTGTHATLHQMRGAYTPLREVGAQIGWVLRSKPKCNPLIVSPGHRVSMAASAQLVMRFVTTDRLPEPTRLADRLASGSDEACDMPPLA